MLASVQLMDEDVFARNFAQLRALYVDTRLSSLPHEIRPAEPYGCTLSIAESLRIVWFNRQCGVAQLEFFHKVTLLSP